MMKKIKLPAGFKIEVYASGVLAAQVGCADWPGGFAKLPYTCGGRNSDPPARSDVIEVEGSSL